MRLIIVLSDLLLPATLFFIIAYGLLNGVDIFKAFIEGAKEGFKIVYEIIPTLLGLFIAIGIVRSSGLIDLITTLLTPIAELLKVPVVIIPVIIFRSVSASAALSLIIDIFQTYGPDSLVGRMTSIMMGCTETIFYTVTVYFSVVNIKKIRYTLWGAVLVSVAGVVASVIITYWVFG